MNMLKMVMAPVSIAVKAYSAELVSSPVNVPEVIFVMVVWLVIQILQVMNVTKENTVLMEVHGKDSALTTLLVLLELLFKSLTVPVVLQVGSVCGVTMILMNVL